MSWELGDNFPTTALYPLSKGLEEQIKYLQRNLSFTGKDLSIGEITFPTSIEQQIALYSDMFDLGGKTISVEERLNEIIERYGELAQTAPADEAHYLRTIVEITSDISFQERIFNVCKNVRKLAGLE